VKRMQRFLRLRRADRSQRLVGTLRKLAVAPMEARIDWSVQRRKRRRGNTTLPPTLFSALALALLREVAVLSAYCCAIGCVAASISPGTAGVTGNTRGEVCVHPASAPLLLKAIPGHPAALIAHYKEVSG
jgi:hypothetical protein